MLNTFQGFNVCAASFSVFDMVIINDEVGDNTGHQGYECVVEQTSLHPCFPFTKVHKDEQRARSHNNVHHTTPSLQKPEQPPLFFLCS